MAEQVPPPPYWQCTGVLWPPSSLRHSEGAAVALPLALRYSCLTRGGVCSFNLPKLQLGHHHVPNLLVFQGERHSPLLPQH